MPTAVAPTYSAIDDAGRFKGTSFVASGMATTIHDFRVPVDIRLHGGHWWVSGSDVGDTVDFQVVDKDDVLGLFSTYGLQPGDILELTKYADKIPMPPSGIFFHDRYVPETCAVVCSGLYLRCTYDNIHSGDANMGLTYIWYEEV